MPRNAHRCTRLQGERRMIGLSVSGAGDVNGDGYDDVIVGAPRSLTAITGVGRAYVISGLNGDTLHVFTGEALGDGFGFRVSGAGDVDSNGYADLIVGAHKYGAADNGKAYVYSGDSGTLLWTFTGESGGDHFGEWVAGAGDIDNDGHADLIVGAVYNSQGGQYAGRAYVYSGRTGALLRIFTGEAANDRFGVSVSGAGDFNNDGYLDLIVGAHGNSSGGGLNAGRAYLFSGGGGSVP